MRPSTTRNGDVVCTAADERCRPPCLGEPFGVANRDRHLDRKDFPQAVMPGQVDPIRMRVIMITAATQMAWPQRRLFV